MNLLRVLLLAASTITALCAPHKHHRMPYQFSYGVNDPHSKDIKSQHEESDGYVIKGSYTVHQADGTQRIVEYTADKEKGFQAIVKVIGDTTHIEYHGHHEQKDDKSSDSEHKDESSHEEKDHAEELNEEEHGEDEKKKSYQFSYGVHDPHSRDIKAHNEKSDGETIKGSYSVEEADGTIRVVEYTADKHNGFQAVVKRIGYAKHPVHKKKEEQETEKAKENED